MNEDELAGGKDIHLMLGLSDSSSLLEIKKAYAQMLKALYSTDLAKSTTGLARLKDVRQRIQGALDQLSQMHQDELKGTAGSLPTESQWVRPKLGQMLVASGLLSLEQLDAALEIQRNTKSHHIFIGEILVGSGYITEKQLAHYLKHQELLRLPPDNQERWGQRLVELGLVTDDQLKVALIDQHSKNITLREAMINRGWLTADVLDRIF